MPEVYLKNLKSVENDRELERLAIAKTNLVHRPEVERMLNQRGLFSVIARAHDEDDPNGILAFEKLADPNNKSDTFAVLSTLYDELEGMATVQPDQELWRQRTMIPIPGRLSRALLNIISV